MVLILQLTDSFHITLDEKMFKQLLEKTNFYKKLYLSFVFNYPVLMLRINTNLPQYSISIITN